MANYLMMKAIPETQPAWILDRHFNHLTQLERLGYTVFESAALLRSRWNALTESQALTIARWWKFLNR